MNAMAYGYDQQVHMIIAERQRQAALARQARVTGTDGRGRPALLNRARALVGRMLIAAGERLTAESGRRGPVQVAPRG